MKSQAVSSERWCLEVVPAWLVPGDTSLFPHWAAGVSPGYWLGTGKQIPHIHAQKFHQAQFQESYVESPQCKLTGWELTIPGAETIYLRKIRVYLYFTPNPEKKKKTVNETKKKLETDFETLKKKNICGNYHNLMFIGPSCRASSVWTWSIKSTVVPRSILTLLGPLPYSPPHPPAVSCLLSVTIDYVSFFFLQKLFCPVSQCHVLLTTPRHWRGPCKIPSYLLTT